MNQPLQRRLFRRAVLVFGYGLSLMLSAAGPGFAQAPKKIDFAHDIVPILKARCAECHTNGKYKGSLSLDTREDLLKAKVVVPGKSAASELYKRITSNDPELRMPSKGKPLSPAEVELVKAWIDAGLPWDAGFTFKVSTYAAPLKPRRPTLPPPREGLEHPIDR
ncbi:MAG TPA: c-type cytochrome domain-containing protein, partial [Gemmataceae bacterium]|nr:c-type cytochrome domain-containing protein [Gemmataceae bacterium]